MNIRMKPVTITGETMSVLREEKNYSDLLALYMTYAEITQWQNNKRIRATGTFMQKRMNWGKDKLTKNKARLIELGLVNDVSTRENGKITGHFIEVSYVVNRGETTPLKTPPVVKSDISTSKDNNKVLVNKKINRSAVGRTKEEKESPKKETEEEIIFGALVEVCKTYELQVVNYNHLRKWSKDFIKQTGFKNTMKYLNFLLEIDFDAIEHADWNQDPNNKAFVPTITRPMDIVEKKIKVRNCLNKAIELTGGLDSLPRRKNETTT